MGGEEDTSRPELKLIGLCSAEETKELKDLTKLEALALLRVILGGVRIMAEVS